MKIRLDRLFILIIAVLLVSCFCFVTIQKLFFNKEEEAPKVEDKIIYEKKISSEVPLDRNIETLITNYMDLYTESLATLEEKDITFLFSNEEEAYLAQTTISYLIAHHKLQPFDMKLNSAKYEITVTDVEEKDDKLIVTFLEDDYFKFNYIKDVESKAYDIKNTLTIELIEDEYKIVSLRKIQDYYVIFSNQYSKQSLEATKTFLDNLKNKYLKESETKIDDILKMKSNIKEIDTVCDNPYNREDAVSYSYNYITKRNSEWFDYSDIGGNCQNYVSQCLYSGGIPADESGSIYNQWKHHDSAINETEGVGRSYSWTTVGYFYDYIKSNVENGICALPDSNFYLIEKGDVAEVGYDKRWGHTVLITESVKINNEIVDYLVNSNTVNLENYPLLAYTYPDLRFIKILGWNN